MYRSTYNSLNNTVCTNHLRRPPLNPKISFVNIKGSLNIAALGEMVKSLGDKCPRIAYFARGVEICGPIWKKLKVVSLLICKGVEYL